MTQLTVAMYQHLKSPTANIYEPRTKIAQYFANCCYQAIMLQAILHDTQHAMINKTQSNVKINSHLYMVLSKLSTYHRNTLLF